jgi:hypothetical protein
VFKLSLGLILTEFYSKPQTHRRLDVASIRILSLSIEDFLVQVDVVVVYGIVEGDCDHHRNIL